MGIGGDKNAIDFELRHRQLFQTIVQSAANTAEKRVLVKSEFVNMKTRGRAVSIGPLEYCGNGIPLKTTHQLIV